MRATGADAAIMSGFPQEPIRIGMGWNVERDAPDIFRCSESNGKIESVLEIRLKNVSVLGRSMDFYIPPIGLRILPYYIVGDTVFRITGMVNPFRKYSQVVQVVNEFTAPDVKLPLICYSDYHIEDYMESADSSCFEGSDPGDILRKMAFSIPLIRKRSNLHNQIKEMYRSHLTRVISRPSDDTVLIVLDLRKRFDQ